MKEIKPFINFNITVKDLGGDVMIILKRTFKKYDGSHGLDGCGSGYGQVAVCCECGNEPSGTTKRMEFLD